MAVQETPRAHTASPRNSAAPDRRGWRDSVAAALLSVCAVGAMLAAVTAVAVVADAGPATKAVETWRLVGYIVTVLLVAAYVLVSGWTAPPPHRWPSSASTWGPSAG